MFQVQAVTVHATNNYFVTASLDNTWSFYDLSSGLCLTQVSLSLSLFIIHIYLYLCIYTHIHECLLKSVKALFHVGIYIYKKTMGLKE